MRKVTTLIALIILALSGVGIWQLSSGAHAAPIGPNGGYGAAISTSIPAMPSTSATATPNIGIPLNPDPKDRVFLDEPPVTPKPPQGRPAIVPTNPDAPLGLPTFDAAAASTYALSGTGWQFTFPPSGPVTVASVEFLTGKQVNEQKNPGIKHPDDRLLCFVTLAGEFNYPAPDPGNPGPLRKPSRLTEIFVLFDARTGNYIGMGGIH